MLPDFGEPAIVHEAAGPGASILELGCGAGRVTHPLIALGHPVVAVDESPEMLAHVRGAETVCARIQDLSLGRRFGAVLLASQTFTTTRLDEAGLTAALAAAGLRPDRYLTEDRSWFRAVPVIVPG